jgi:hypothetical protein
MVEQHHSRRNRARVAPGLNRAGAVLLALGLVYGAPAVAEDVYRWVDEDGKVHYGRTLPPEYANKPYDILNAQGVVIERVTDPLARQKAPKDEKGKVVVQEEPDEGDDDLLQSDQLLVLRYHSIEEIEEAMEVEVAQLKYDTLLINQSRASAMTALVGQVRSAANRQRAGLPVEAETENDINSLRQSIRRSERSLAALQEREEKIRASFLGHLERYRYLQAGGEPGSEPES